MPAIGEGREAEIRPWGDGRVLRLLRDVDGGARLATEATVLDAVAATDVVVPRPYEQVVVDGRPGLVMDRIDGSDLLDDLERHPWRLPGIARRLGELQARLHDVVAPETLPPLRTVLAERLTRAPQLSTGERIGVEGLLAALPDGDRICHGDFHPGNVIVDGRGPVIIDWTNASRGDPMGDLARTVLILRTGALPGDPPLHLRVVDRLGRGLFRRFWVAGYRGVRRIDVELMGRWYPVWAAARLAEGITEEEPALLAAVRHGLDA